MTRIQVFLLTEVPCKRIELRRYSYDECPCPGPYGNYHNADVILGEIDAPVVDSTYGVMETDDAPEVANDDPRWPTRCDYCPYVFQAKDLRQVNDRRLYGGAPDGKLYDLLSAPVGAMWYAGWYHAPATATERSHCPYWDNCDGRHLIVRLPPDGHDWDVDSRCSNCGSPTDRLHRCWVRHGEPPSIHVDKQGVTCAAGAGSIQTPRWHGFLHRGILSENG